MGKEESMVRKKNTESAQARSPNIDANSILEICDKTMDVVQYIEQVSDHDISVSKVVAACSSLML